MNRAARIFVVAARREIAPEAVEHLTVIREAFRADADREGRADLRNVAWALGFFAACLVLRFVL